MPSSHGSTCSDLTDDEAGLLELYKAETVLLKFAKTIRLSMHNSKANIVRMNAWSDYSAIIAASQRNSLAANQYERTAIEKILVKLPVVNANPMTGQGGIAEKHLRLRSACTARNWKSDDSQKLRSMVIDGLASEYVCRRAELDDHKEDNAYRKKLRVELEETTENCKDPVWVKSLMEKVENVLEESALRDPSLTVSDFWNNFWDSLAITISSTSSTCRSGRECHAHWIHFHDPRLLHDHTKQWTKEEESSLLALLEELGGGQWQQIADRLQSGRSVFEIYRHYQTALNTRLTTKQWTPEMDKKLTELVDRYKGERTRIWTKIAAHFHDKSNEQCRLRYESGLTSSVKRGHWLCEEDIRLQVLVAYFGRGNWRKVGQYMPMRTDMKCRERYENLLAPELQKSKWSTSEDEKLLALVRQVGPGQWARTAELMGGRTDSECAKRWLRLDPLGALTEGGKRAAKCLFIPNQVRQRNHHKPALTATDFQLHISDQLQVLLKYTMKLEGVGGEDSSSSVSPKKRRRFQKPSVAALALTDVDGQAVVPIDKEKIKGLSLLNYYMKCLSTGMREADSQFNNIKKRVLRSHQFFHNLPKDISELPSLTGLEEDVMKDLAQQGVSLASLESSWIDKDEILLPDYPEFHSPPRQECLRNLLQEMFRSPDL